MKNFKLFLSFYFLLGFSSQAIIAQPKHLAKDQANPVIPGYFADPTVKKFGDTFYIYATTDGNGGGFGPSQVWTSKDFMNWTMQDMNWPTTHQYWAPDATQGPDGRYYLYYCQPVEIFGASSESPVGPWKSLLPPGKPIVENFKVPNVITLDGQTFKDDDGKYYMYWGTWGIYPNHGCGVGLLNADMKSFSKLAQIPNTDAKEFFEAPFVFKRKGIYYFTYSSGYCEDGTYRVQYATSTSPMGPFKYAPNNPILSTNGDGTVHGPGHQSVLQQGEDFYLIYHRHNNPHNDGGYHRQVAADKLVFDEKGNILKLVPTHSGIGYLAKNENPHENLALGKTATASSVYDDDFKAAFALDDNNGTLWKAKDNVGPSWLMVDLGKIYDVKSVHTQFEYATWYYQYKIEYSLDGKTWKLYADKSNNTQHGSPLIDFGNVQARYLRTTILRTEYPGLNRAIWNMKVFDNAEYRPLMNTKSKKWESLKRFESRGLLVDLNFDALEIGSSVSKVSNHGKLAGEFSSNDTFKPTATMIKGKKALLFSGMERLSSSNPTPSSMLGNGSYTVNMWVLNPEINTEETLVSWTSKGGDNLSNAAVGYGTSKSAGAATHLGWADLGYKHVPKADEWHLITMVFDGTMERIYVDGTLDRAERRMLFVNKLSRFLIGGNDDGTAGFSGALASLKIYDVPLTSQEIKAAYVKGVSSHTIVYVNAKSQSYGRLLSLANHGTALGELAIHGKVADINGKIAIQLVNNSKMYLGEEMVKTLNFSKPFSAIFSIFAARGSKTNLYLGKGRKAIQTIGNGKWQQVICTYKYKKFKVCIDGQLAENVLITSPQNDPRILLEISNHTPQATNSKTITSKTVTVAPIMAISSITIYDYGLDRKACLKEYNFWKQTSISHGITASFFSKPLANTPNMVYMVANRPELPGADLEYLFQRDQDKGNVKWLTSADYTDFTVASQRSYNYTVKIRDHFGNVTATSTPSVVSTDTSLFLIRKQHGNVRAIPAAKDGLAGTSWDGLTGNADTVIQDKDILTMVSHHTLWDGSESTGPFAYQNVSGDFVAEVMLSDVLGLKQKITYGANEAGLMVKLPANTKMLLQNGVMPGWGVGNIVTDLNAKDRKQSNNFSGWSFFRHLQIQRIGNTFFMRGSHNGMDWHNLPGSPIKRNDLNNLALLVGVYHATYGDISGYASFRNFRLIQRR
jgi:beta-xylosidase